MNQSLIDKSVVPADVSEPVQVFSGNFRIDERDDNGAYVVEVWKAHEGTSIAVIRDCMKNTSLENAGRTVASSLKTRWPDLNYIVEYWPDTFAGCYYRMNEYSTESRSVPFDQLDSLGLCLREPRKSR